MKESVCLDQNWVLLETDYTDRIEIPSMPMQVHEILHMYQYISDDYLIGLGQDSQWVAQTDWTYQCVFELPEKCLAAEHVSLYFEELDTLAEIYFNGQRILSCNDIYLRYRVEVSELLQEKNTLQIRFESPYRYMAEHPLLPQWEGKVRHRKLIRKPVHDFDNYLGAQPYITLIGVAGPIALEWYNSSEIQGFEVSASLSDNRQTGTLSWVIKTVPYDSLQGILQLEDPDGQKISEIRLAFSGSKDVMVAQGTIEIETPRLWWPRGFGEQPLYRVQVSIFEEKGMLDRMEKSVGFREIKTDSSFRVELNGISIRLWGTNLAPLNGKTHCYDHMRACEILSLAERANMNTIRIWSEGEPFPDRLYDELDRRGFLVWQEFYSCYGMQPDYEEYRSLCAEECTQMVLRLRHHPSIFMWCGGNECWLGRDFLHPGEKCIGEEIYTEIYPAICHQLDPDRYYHPTSPSGGDFANDPRTGDTHGYEMWWYSPGMEYPVAFSEHMRSSPAAAKSLRRFIPQKDFWPDDFIDVNYYSNKNDKLMPPAWLERMGAMPMLKSGRIHEYRDAQNAEELIYKFAAAHADSLKIGIERSRMGRPSGGSMERICNCHMIWKLNDTYPLIYSAIIDYYLEPFMPYYAAKRGYAPIIVCFDVRDSINLWLVNDSNHDTCGRLEFGIFNPGENRFIAHKTMDVRMASGVSGEVANLDCFGGFRMENLLYARYIDEPNQIDVENFKLMDIERRLLFPDCQLTLEVEGGDLLVSSDRYAHCVELGGNAIGEDFGDFGWYFDDNYFNLLPNVTKRIKISGKHDGGVITAKAHYSPNITTIHWIKKNRRNESHGKTAFGEDWS